MGDAVAEGAVRAREQCVLVFYVQCADDAAHAMSDAVAEGAVRARVGSEARDGQTLEVSKEKGVNREAVCSS